MTLVRKSLGSTNESTLLEHLPTVALFARLFPANGVLEPAAFCSVLAKGLTPSQLATLFGDKFT